MCESTDDDGGLLELWLDLELGIRRSCIIPSSSSECFSTSSSSSLSLHLEPLLNIISLPRLLLLLMMIIIMLTSLPAAMSSGGLLWDISGLLAPPQKQFYPITFILFFVSTTVIQSRKDRGRPHPHIHIVSPYVKVNMDGFPIGQKIHLPSFHSDQALAQKLHVMFFINSQPSISNFSFIDQLLLLLPPNNIFICSTLQRHPIYNEGSVFFAVNSSFLCFFCLCFPFPWN